ncbi:lipopolysaccharide biosynthesis protein [Ethanoligenens sp.]|uniref:lipopolysaccharide biosynthesis protein n=1 Tax=Ethanoligenens sp. TaxID=2099655 RepID=UPI0039EBF77E
MANGIIKRGIANIKYVLLSQFSYYIVTFFTSFILPGVLGVVPNGYYQIYFFYTTSFVGLMHIGFNDGVFLKYGGYDFEKLPQELFRTFMRMYICMNGIETVAVLLIVLMEPNANKQFAFTFAAFDIVAINLSTLLNYINQATGRIKLYSFVVVAEKVQIVAGLAVMLLLHHIDFHAVIVLDFAAKVVVLFVNVYCCRDLFWGERVPWRAAWGPYWDNIRVGVKLMIANVMAMLVMGAGKLMMERLGSVANFSEYSFATNVTNIAMAFISAVGLVLYPVLCRLEKKTLPYYFQRINRLLCAFIFTMMLLYYPLVPIIRVFLPKYDAVLAYLPLLFPIVIMQSKMQLLINNYYESLREEKAMMWANISAVGLFVAIALPLYLWHPSVMVIVWVTLGVFFWRCYASELFLKHKLGIHSMRNMVEEWGMGALFILANSLLGWGPGLAVYAAAVAVYLLVYRKELVPAMRTMLKSAFDR